MKEDTTNIGIESIKNNQSMGMKKRLKNTLQNVYLITFFA